MESAGYLVYRHLCLYATVVVAQLGNVPVYKPPPQCGCYVVCQTSLPLIFCNLFT